MTSLRKIHQLRCRYAQEIQQQQQQHHQSSSGIDDPPQLDRRKREAQEMLQLKLQRFFDSLPAGRRRLPAAADSTARPAADALPPKSRLPRSRAVGMATAAALRRPTAATTTAAAASAAGIAEQLNTNSSVAQASNAPAAAWPAAAGDELANTLSSLQSCTLTSNSLDVVTAASDVTNRDGSLTSAALPGPRDNHREGADDSVANAQALPPTPPKLLSQSRARSSSLASMLGRSGLQQERRTVRAVPPPPLQPQPQPPAFVDHLRHLLDDFCAATAVSATLMARKQQQHQQQQEQQSKEPPAAPPPQPPPRRSRTGRKVQQAGASTSGGGQGARPRRSASAGCRAGAPAGRRSAVCQVFQVGDVDAVRSTLVAKDDRRVAKILGQFDCQAEVIDTVQVSPARAAAMICLAAPSLEQLQWCIGRIDAVFPGWELKCQMRGYRRGSKAS